MVRARKGLVFLIEIDANQVIQRICVSTSSGIFWQRLCGSGGWSVFLDEEIPVGVVRDEIPAVADKDMPRVRKALERVVQQFNKRLSGVA